MGHPWRKAALGAVFALTLVLAYAQPALAEGATVTQDANLRAAPTTDSAVLAERAAGDPVEVLCWTTGEPTFGADRYGAMWLLTDDFGYVHSYLVTPDLILPTYTDLLSTAPLE